MVKVIIDQQTRQIMSFFNEVGSPAAREEDETPDAEPDADAPQNTETKKVVADMSVPEGCEVVEVPGHSRLSLAAEAEEKAGGPPGRMWLTQDRCVQVEGQAETSASGAPEAFVSTTSAETSAVVGESPTTPVEKALLQIRAAADDRAKRDSGEDSSPDYKALLVEDVDRAIEREREQRECATREDA